MFVVSSYLTWCSLCVNTYVDEEQGEQWRQQQSFERPFFFDIEFSILPTKFSQANGSPYVLQCKGSLQGDNERLI